MLELQINTVIFIALDVYLYAGSVRMASCTVHIFRRCILFYNARPICGGVPPLYISGSGVCV